MSKTLQHPLEYHAAARAYFEKVAARASKGPAAVWREAVEQLTGGLPSWAARKIAGRTKKAAQAVK
ncbi:hypothetical protein [Paraburkholderia sp. DGU8]|uniref:hypothetical protein n=1 Tax=Paraburkholderia sp. DGU8 TaxID=3161997 RepID=UPI0034659758